VNLDSSAFVAEKELLDALTERATPIVCAADGVLFKQGDEPTGLYILRSGVATLTMYSQAGEMLIDVRVAEGALLGLPGVIGNHPYSLTASVIKGAELSFITREDFAQLMLSDPALSLKVLRVLAAEVRSARGAITEE
jgi:CRP/FNR family transcriptional regulator, polysaccharide utilization system transcription regulator